MEPRKKCLFNGILEASHFVLEAVDNFHDYDGKYQRKSGIVVNREGMFNSLFYFIIIRFPNPYIPNQYLYAPRPYLIMYVGYILVPSFMLEFSQSEIQSLNGNFFKKHLFFKKHFLPLLYNINI